METNNLNEKSNNKADFRRLWERRKQAWRQEAELNAPNDDVLLKMAQRARSASAVPEEIIMPATIRKRGRWVPYAVAAGIAAGIVFIGVNRAGISPDPLPTVQEVNVEGNIMFFMCNNGCSVQDVVLSANDVIKK